jgi:phenylalanine-4-hydroxylase
MLNLLKLSKRGINTQLRYFGETAPAKPDIKHSVIGNQNVSKLWEIQNRTSLQFTLSESHGVLNKALNILTSNKINLTRINSKPSKIVENNWRTVDFFIDLEGSLKDKNVIKAISELKLIAEKVTEVGSVEVPWFPTRIEDFDHIGKNVFGEEEIGSLDHPQFRDPVYKARREFITNIAFTYNIRDPEIPRVEYTKDEVGVWRYCYPKLRKLL